MAGEDRSYRCLTSLPNQQFLPRLPSVPLGGKTFTVTALPFGLCIAPAVFQGLINHPIALARTQGVQCLGYLDDLLVFAQSQEKCQKDLLCLKSHLERLGFIINLKKSQLYPSQELEWLGARVDGRNQALGLPQDKVSKITGMATSLLSKGSTSRAHWESLLGQLAFACQIGPELNLRKKLLGPIVPLLPCQESVMCLPSQTMEALRWWTVKNLLLKNLLDFKRYICTSYLRGSVKHKTTNRTPFVAAPNNDVRFDQTNHVIIKRAKQRRCQYPQCKGKPLTYCQKCNVTLCVDCFFAIS